MRVHQVRASSQIALVFFGQTVGGAICLMTWLGTCLLGLAVVFCSVPGPLQSVQRAEFWESFLLFNLLDVDSLGVVRHVGRLLDGNVGSRPAELVKDGDLIQLIGRMLRIQGFRHGSDC